MNDALSAEIISIISKILKCSINADASRENTPVWDSLRHIDIIMTLEDAFSIEFPATTIESLKSINDIDRAVRECRYGS